MKLPFTIEDYYGTKVEVEPLMASPGPVVDIDLQRLLHVGDDGSSFLRFELEDALKLAEAIKAAVEAPR